MRGTGIACRVNSRRRRAPILAAAMLPLCAAAWGLTPLGAVEPPTSAPANEPALEEVVGLSSLAQRLVAASQPAEAPRQIIEVGKEDRVTMHVKDMPLADALRVLSNATKRNILLANGASGAVTASLYNVTFDEALQAMMALNGLTSRVEGNFIYVLKLEDLAKMVASQRKVESRVFRLQHIGAEAAAALLKPLLTPSVGQISLMPAPGKGLGGNKGLEDTEGNSATTVETVIVTDYPETIEQMAKILRDVDIRPKQVLVEATILRATLNEDNALGIDFTTVGGIDFQTLGSTSPAAQSITTGNTPAPFLDVTTFTARTDLNAGVPAGGFTFGIIKDQVGVFIRALEQITDTEILANPKVLALNKQVGQVIVGRRDGYLTTTITETTAVQKVEFLETGTLLSFRPFIGDDGLVRMEIHPKDSTGGLTSTNLPFEQTTEVTTNILVPDGRTILIGGLFREVSTATRGQMPLLGDVPWLGALFRTSRDNTVREEVIILLTVHILKDEADFAADDELYQDVERYRVGMRRGIHWLGRERLAQAHYHWATDHMARGNLDMAALDARMALHNCPRHVPAAKLLEEITQKRAWESDGSTIRSFVHDRIAETAGVKAPPFGRPLPRDDALEDMEGPTGFENGDETPNPRQEAPDEPAAPETSEGRP